MKTLILLLLLGACAAPVALPLPEPPMPPVPRVAPPAPGLKRAYAAASARLDAYLAQPLCVPSGPIACVDPALATQAVRARRRAIGGRGGKVRVDAFVKLVGILPVDGGNP